MRVKNSSLKRHKCRAPIVFLNQPCLGLGACFFLLDRGAESYIMAIRKDILLNLNNEEGRMKSEHSNHTERAQTDSIESQQLLSLLALAAGAVMIPQTGEADVIYTNLVPPEAIGPGLTGHFVIDNLPGGAKIGFYTHTKTASFGLTTTRWITVGQVAGYVNLKFQNFGQTPFAVPATQGKVWGSIVGNVRPGGLVAYWAETFSGRFSHPGNFNDKYFAFQFKDADQANLMCYGWIKVDLANSTGNNGAPDLTLYSWAYDTTGTQLPMGSTGVPEPGSAALLALGALTLGARGLRHWRRNRPAAS
jgi:hypothetical protein